MEPTDAVARMESTLQNARADLVTQLGDERTHATARVWQGRVLIDWDPDEQAGGCLLRPALIRRLLTLHASIETGKSAVRLTVPGRLVSSLSPTHAALIQRLGGAAHVQLEALLRFDGDEYVGGEETYFVRARPLLRLSASVRRVQPASPQTMPARS